MDYLIILGLGLSLLYTLRDIGLYYQNLKEERKQ